MTPDNSVQKMKSKTAKGEIHMRVERTDTKVPVLFLRGLLISERRDDIFAAGVFEAGKSDGI